MEKKVTEGEIKRVVKEYIERVFKSLKTHKFSGDDERIDCPGCKSYRGIELKENGWICLWRNCPFRFSKELMPPTPGELRAFFNRKKIEERINEFLNN